MRHLMTLLSILLLAPAAVASGLLAPTDQTLPPLRVTDHLVDVRIHDQVGLTTLTQTFRNDTDRRLEATYVFPLPDQADLTDFQMTFNGKLVKGRVLPAQEARQIYESIVRQAKDPGLIEFIGRRLLQMRVFPIEPRSDTTIQVRYQQVCRPISGLHGYHYPLRTSRTTGQAYGTVRFNVSLQTTAALKNIWSPSHAVEIVRDGEHRASIAYEAAGGSLEEDFLLLYGTDSSDLGLSAMAHQPTADRSGHFALMLTPRQLWPEQEYQPQDVVFVVDTSGSMAGEKIDQARKALGYCIDQLDDRDRFSVVRFSTGFDVLFDPLRPATKDARRQAREWIGRFSAAGGTNIADTLQHVMTLGGEDDSDRPFVVVFLTDGRGNRQPDEIMKALSTRPGTDRIRIFPFGVGHDVNTILLDRLATTYRARPTYVQPGENLELVLGDFFSVVSQPVLTGLKLTLPAIGVTERFPATLGDLYHGQQLIVAGRFDSPRTGPVKLTATRNGRRVEYEWPSVAFTHTPEATYLPSLWAGRKIAYLIDQIRIHGENQEMISEIVALAQEHGIQTPYTSWLVDPERQTEVLTRAAGVGGGGARGRDVELGLRRLEAQRVVVERFAAAAPPPRASMTAPATGYNGLTVAETELAVADSAGKAATIIARRNAELRDMVNRDEGRLDSSLLLRQRIGGRWYNRIGAYLTDETIDTDTQITIVRFGSEAYFELARNRADLRAVLAKGRHVVVLVTEGHAILVADDEGVASFDDELRAKLRVQRD